MTPKELLDQLNSLDETTRIEAKTASEVGKSILETVTAFANEPGLGGGWLLLGVRSEESLFEPVYKADGIDDPDKLQRDLASQCAGSLNVPIRPEFEVQEIDGKTVISAFIPEAAPADKPVFIEKLGLPRGAFRRTGSTDQHGTEDDLIVLYAGRQLETFDASVVPDGTMDDIDDAAIEEYRRMRAQVNPSAEELSWSNEDLLRAFGCARHERGELRPTVSGILLFGKTMALRRCFPMMRIDYIRIPGREWVQDPDRRFDTVEIRAPLIPAIRKAQAAILDDLPKSFSLPEGELQSRQTPLLPDRVIREAVVNAVMHRSYRIHGPIQILRYANRLEIRNPGHSLKSPDSLGQPGSETRNPKVAAVLHEVNAAETKGSGIRVMRQLMLDANLTPPLFESAREPDQFVASFLFHHFLGPEDVAWLGSLTSEKLDDLDARSLVFVREVGAIDNLAFRNINQTDTLDASTHLRRLRKLKLLEKKGGGNQTYYVPGPLFQIPESTGVAKSTKVSPKSTKVDGKSTKLPVDLAISDLPADLAQRITALGKIRGEKVRVAIQMLCHWRPLTSQQLASVLGRKRQPLVRDHLKPMIEAEALRYGIPELPQHPDQTYAADQPADSD